MNKIIKRIVSAVTAVAVTLTAVVVFDVPKKITAAAASGSGWSLDDKGKLTIENNTGMTNWKRWKDGWDGDAGLVKSVVIQDGVTSIGETAFSACNAMSSIAIPNSVTSIGKNAFNGCKKMSSIAIPNSVTSIDDYAFSYCEALSSITIPNGVTSIGNTAFAHCTGLSSITISASVTKMGVDVNIGCKKIETITFEGAPPSGTIAIINYTDGDLTTIYVPCNFVEDYKSAEVLERTLSGKIQPKHNPAQVAAKAATCAAEGNVAHWHCSKCDKNFTDNTCATEITDIVIPKTGNHTWNAGTVTTAATCTTKGVKTYTCSVCNATKTEDIAFLGHNWSTSWTTDGNNHWHTCTRSGCTSVDSKAAHSGGTATCQTQATCTVCGQKYGSLGAHDHSTTWSKDDTQHWHACQTAGCTDKSDTADHTFVQKKDGTNHWQECSVCGYKKDITAHSWSNWTLKTEPTLTTTGTAERTCDCGEKDTKSDVPALTDPIWTSGNRTDPTLDGAGSEDYTSTDYGKVIITIPALSNETVWTKTSHKDATEEAEGEDVYESTDYGTVTVILPRLDHTHVWGDWEITKAPTLNDEGTAKHVCTKDDTHIDTETLPVLTDDTVWTKGDRTDPTLNGTGSQKYTSTDYGEVTITIPVLTDPIWTKGDRTDPTLNGTGSQKYTSTDYGEVTITIPKLTDPIWTKGDRTDPTLDSTGSEEYTSTDYGKVTIIIPALSDETVWRKTSHKDATEEAEGEDVYESTDYGTVTVILPRLDHTHVWGDWEITKAPTLNDEGMAKRVCTKNAEHTETETLPVLSDNSVWTKDNTKHVDPTEEDTGKDVYTSKYGEVEVELPVKEHTHVWGDWSITVNPTLTETGTARRVCTKNSEHTDTKTLPVLTDDSVWTKDEDQHVDPTEDNDGKDVYTSDYGEVTDILPALGHTHNWGDWTIATAPTLTETGTAQRVCTLNNTHIDTRALPVLTDTTVWTKDENKHVPPTEQTEGKDVYTSEYGEVTNPLDKLPHTHDDPLKYVPEVKPTEDDDGVKEHWHCDGCGKDFEDEDGTKEVTADDLKIGKIKTEVQAPANVPKPEIATPKEELIAAALTEDEQKKVDEGTDIKIILKVEDASSTVSAEDKGNVETAIGNLTDHKLGQYLDVTLLKKIGEQQEQKITNTNKPITITFEIPESLHGKSEYSVIRVHNGEATVLEDKDNEPNTVTIETDKFSTYALTYKEKTSGGGSHRPTNPDTSDTSDDTSSDTSDDTSSDTSDNTSSDTSESTSGDTSDNTSSDTSESTSDETSDNTPSDTSESTSGDTSDSTSSDTSDNTSSSIADSSASDNSSSGESSHIPSESGTSSGDNPATGIAVSLIPLTVAVAFVIATAKRRHK